MRALGVVALASSGDVRGFLRAESDMIAGGVVVEYVI
jgi:hypothetical protein